MKTLHNNYCNSKQGYLPLFLSDCLDLLDPVLTFDRLMGGIDLNKYLTDIPEYTTGRLRYNPVNMLKTVLFGFMTSGYCSLRELEDNCKVNIRFMYLMDHQTPSYRTFGYFINEILQDKIENIFNDINHGISSFKGVAVDRDQFLYSTFKKYSQEDIQSIISLGPPQAGVEKKEIDRIADKIIRKSKWSTTGVSFLTGMPGGFAMAATLPADILQFYLQAFILLQKLMFLYGQWDDDFFDSVGEMTEDARNVTIVYIGYMLGVEAATKVVGNIVAKATSRSFIIKTLIKSALGREMIIKIVRAIGIKSTAKAVSAGSKAIPILGAVVSGGITLISFAPMANRLKVTLSKMI